MNHKKTIIIGFWAVAAVIVLIIIGSVIKGVTEDENKNKINVYFFNSMSNELIAEEHFIDISDQKTMIGEVMEEISKPPKNTGYKRAFPEEVQILNVEVENGFSGSTILKINLSKDFEQLSESEQLICRAAVVWSFTSLDFIDGVKINIEGKPLKNAKGQNFGKMNRNNVVLNPIISPDKINTQAVILYFLNSDGIGLCEEKRNIEVKQSLTLENQIVEQLIRGPESSSLMPTVSLETKIGNIKTEEGICYVDLSSDFISKQTNNSSAEEMTIYSIVNSLTELQNVKKVQFLIEGEKVNDFNGKIDLSKPFERDESKIIKSGNEEKK